MVDVPVLFDDPWTRETLLRFRDRHQDPDATDLEYAARINGFEDVQRFISALSGAPYIVTMIGFVPGLPFCYQLVSPDRQIEVPKYVRPRTDTPERAFGFGGAFAVIYPVRGAGGYQLFGLAPAPVFDLSQTLPDFADSIVFPKPGDVLRYRAIDQTEFDQVRTEVERGTFRYRIREFEFKPAEFLADPDAVIDFVEREQPAGAGSDPANVVDLGYPIGSIQVPGGDEPIVLLNDAVTGGGYATIATVISADRDIFGQAKTGDRVRFVSVDLETALAARSQRRERLERLRATLTP
ncbi:carboxyltransferase domain-containing protein [Saccharopolyspora hattusasensis]|uniref:carboxyltransferase domain-containing protein n=1 Tax=Saccharopolyspora hattusasensis TaxID=1128679 RepID=UPI003D986E80